MGFSIPLSSSSILDWSFHTVIKARLEKMSFPLKEVFFDSMGLSVTAAVGYVIAPRILNSYIGRNTMRNILVIKTLHNKGNFKILILSEYLCICVSFFKKAGTSICIFNYERWSKKFRKSHVTFCLWYNLLSGEFLKSVLSLPRSNRTD